MKNFMNTIRNLIKLGKIVSVDDSDDFTIYNSSFLGKNQNVKALIPYGIMCNPPANNIGLVFANNGLRYPVEAVYLQDH